MDGDRPWWKEAVIYHIYLRSFADGDDDGLGDLAGLTAHLGHLRGGPDSLGIDAVWITRPSPPLLRRNAVGAAREPPLPFHDM